MSRCLALLLLLILAPAAQAARYPGEADDFRFPGADTIALQDGSGRYITYGASADGRRVPWSVSGNGAEVGTSAVVGGDALAGGPGAWAEPGSGIWTPGAWYQVKKGVGRYYLFYTASQRRAPGAADRKCVGVASSTDPTQGFQASPEPLACPTKGTRWALDADVTSGPDGAVWVTYRDGERANGPESALATMIVKFNRKGGVRRVTQPRVIMRSDHLTWPDYNGAGRGVTVIENPSAFYDNGSWYLFYSGNSWPTNFYATGIASCGPRLDDDLCTPIGGPKRAYFAYKGPKAAYPKSMRVRGLPGNKRGPGAMDVYRALDGQPWVTWNYLSDAQPGSRRSRTGRLIVTGTGASASFAVR
jgi:hypothetical protein